MAKMRKQKHVSSPKTFASKSSQMPTKENFSSFLLSFVNDNGESTRRTLLTVLEMLSLIDLTKSSHSNLSTTFLLYIEALKKVMFQIANKKVLFPVPAVISCAEMLVRMMTQKSPSFPVDYAIIQTLFFPNQSKSGLPSIPTPTLHTHKLAKIRTLNAFLAFLIHHHSVVHNIYDFFAYSIILMLNFQNSPNLVHAILPQKYHNIFPKSVAPTINADELSVESLDQLITQLQTTIDPIIILLVRFFVAKMYDKTVDNLIDVPGLYDTILLFFEENNEINIDSYTPLFLYYTSNQVSYPIPLTYLPTHQFLFFSALGLANLYEPADEDILLSTISFEQYPEPSLALVFSFNLTTSFISNFLQYAVEADLNYDWKAEMDFLRQFVKFPPKMDELIEQSKSNNLEAIKFLLKDAKCLPLLSPDSVPSHKLIKAFHEPIPENPIPHITEFNRETAILFYRYLASKFSITKEQAVIYMNDIDKELQKLTNEYCNNDVSLYHMIYSGINPMPNAKQFPGKTISSPEDLFAINPDNKFENLSMIIDLLYSLMLKLHFDYSADGNLKNILHLAASFHVHYALSLLNKDRADRLFGPNYRSTAELVPIEHLIFLIQNSQKVDYLNRYKSLIRNLNTLNAFYLLKNIYKLKNAEITSSILPMMPPLPMIPPNTFTDAELLDLISISLSSGLSKNVMAFINRLIQMGKNDEVLDVLFSNLASNAPALSSIFKSFPNSNQLAQYFFSHFELLPNEISLELASLILKLTNSIQQSNDPIPETPRREGIPNTWPESQITQPEQTISSKNETKFPFSTPDEPSIWEVNDHEHCTYLDTGNHYEDQPFFRCLTCKFTQNEGVCSYCATHCHKGHRIYYDSNVSCYCDCFNHGNVCQCNPRNNHDQKTENSSESNQKIDLDTNTIIKYFLKMAESKFIKLSKDDINSASLIAKECIDSGQLSSGISNSFPNIILSSVLRRSLSSPPNSTPRNSKRSFTLCCYCGNNIGCYATTSYNIQLFRTDVQFAGDSSFRSAFGSSSQPDSNILYKVVYSGGSYIACIYDTSIKLKKLIEKDQPSTGTIADHIRSLEKQVRDGRDQSDINQSLRRLKTLKNELSRSGGVPYLLADSIEFAIPNFSSFLDCIFIDETSILALSSAFIFTFNINSTTPISLVKIDELISFTSFCLVKHNDHKYAVAGMSNGQIDIYQLDENLKLTKEKTIDFSKNRIVVSSSNIEYDYFFVGTDEQPVEMCRTKTLFENNQTYVEIAALKGLYRLTSESKIDDNIVYIFTNSSNGNIMKIEFRDNAIYYSKGDRFTETPSLNEMVPQILGSFIANNALFSMSSDGRIAKIRLTDDVSDSDFSFSFGSSSNLFGRNYPSTKAIEEEVPLTFWSDTIINPEGVSIKSEHFPKANSLLKRFSEIRDIPLSKDISFTISVDSPQYTIVGIRIFGRSMSAHTQLIKFQSRQYVMLNHDNYPTCLPLQPNEIEPGKSVEFVISPTHGMVPLSIRTIQVHCMLTDQITVPSVQKPIKTKPIPFDWVSQSTSLFGFSQSSLETIPNDDILSQIALNLANSVHSNVTIDDKQFHDLILAMYSNDVVSLQCRLIISKLKFDEDDHAQRIWAGAMKEVVENQLVSKSQIELLRRDYLLLDEKYRPTIKNLIWTKLPQNDGLYCMISAFY